MVKARSNSAAWICLLALAYGLTGVMAGLASTPAYAQAPPNIVLIITDDQGWTDSSAQMDPDIPNSRSIYYQTPNLEALANAGMRFSNGYSAAPQCSQTRASLLTGKSPAQLQMTDLVGFQTGSALGFPLSGPIPETFDPTQLTLPRVIKQANPNYQTAISGKWHLELPGSVTPQASGFDQRFFGGNTPDDPDGVFKIAQHANNFMQNAVAAGKPFFLQVAHDAVHEIYRPDGSAYIPARPELVDKYTALITTPPGIHRIPEYAALLEDLDTAVGQTLDKINELGIADNTYVFYVSDNGGSVKYTNNSPLKSGKATINEGGIRVPFMAKGPGIQAGAFSDVPVSTTDLMSTIASLVGYSQPFADNVESADFSPVLFNGGQLPAGMDHLDRAFAEHGELYFHYPHFAGNGARLAFRPASAVRDGDYKLYVEYDELGGPDRVFLYNLETNPGESINLAAQMPQKASELKGMLDNYLEAVDASMSYDVKTPIQLAWNAGQPGAEAKGWRSTIDVQYKGRETWYLGGGAEKPTLTSAPAYQPGLSGQAFSFDGTDVMRHVFFHVADKIPRNTNIQNITMGTADFDRSASVEMWFRPADLNHNQILFEAGDGASGMSLTLGDANGDGLFNDLRLRVRGAGTQGLDMSAPIDAFADPLADFIHATAVINDSNTDRYVELYVNGALAGRVDVPDGAANSLNWDGYDQAGLGRTGGNGLGGDGGTGNLPFKGSLPSNGGFVGQMNAVSFWNTALTSSAVATKYNAMLDPVELGVETVAGAAGVPFARPTNVGFGATESSSLLVIEERRGELAAPLTVNAAITGATTIQSPAGLTTSLPQGTEFTSYLLHFDAPGVDGSSPPSVSGSVTFEEDIIAIIYDGALLATSDGVLGSIGDYGAMENRGLPWTEGDALTIDESQRTLSFNLDNPGNDLLQFRVLTGLAGVEPGLDADFNNDGVVDGLDLVHWTTADGSSIFADADHDGDSDGNDFLIWQRSLGQGSPTPPAGAIPEPAAAVLAAIALLASVVGRRCSRVLCN